jgi:peptide chain release factor 1
MSVLNQEERSQDQNRKRAIEILKQKLFEVEYRKNITEEDKRRKQQVGTMERSEKIRTYNYPQNRITDHRTNLTLYGMDLMMAGTHLQKFIDAYQDKMYTEKLVMLLADLKKEGQRVDV